MIESIVSIFNGIVIGITIVLIALITLFAIYCLILLIAYAVFTVISSLKDASNKKEIVK